MHGLDLFSVHAPQLKLRGFADSEHWEPPERSFRAALLKLKPLRSSSSSLLYEPVGLYYVSLLTLPLASGSYLDPLLIHFQTLSISASFQMSISA